MRIIEYKHCRTGGEMHEYQCRDCISLMTVHKSLIKLFPAGFLICSTKSAIIFLKCLQWATRRSLVPDSAHGLGDILAALSSAPIVNADVGYKGTQLKVSLVLKGGQRAVFKPKWLVHVVVEI